MTEIDKEEKEENGNGASFSSNGGGVGAKSFENGWLFERWEVCDGKVGRRRRGRGGNYDGWQE